MDTTSDVLKDSIESTNKLSGCKQIYSSSWSKMEESKTPTTHLEKESLKAVGGLFQHNSCKYEDDNISLHSIWTPTKNDNLRKMAKNSYESPLIDLGTTLDSNSNSKSVHTSPTDSTSAIFKNPSVVPSFKRHPPSRHVIESSSHGCSCRTDYNRLFDREISENFQQKYRNKNTSSKVCDTQTYESSVDITSKNSNPKHRNSKNYICENISRRNSNNKPGKNYDSENSLNELNEETFGELSYSSNVPELTLSDISEATAACEVSKNEYDSKTQNNKPRLSEYSKTLKKVQETTTGTKPKIYTTNANRQSNLQRCNPRKEVKQYHDRRNLNGKKEFHKSSFSNSDKILSLSRENLAIRKARPPQSKFKKHNPNKQSRNATRKTFHSGISPDQEIATRTRETFRTKGDTSYYASEKTTYIRGKKQDNTSKNIVWKNDICDFRNITDTEMSYETKNKKYFSSNLIPNHDNKGERFLERNENRNYEKHDLNKSNNLVIQNQNNSKRQQFNSGNQRKPPKNENEDVFLTRRNPCEDGTKGKSLWQLPEGKLKEFKSDEPTNVSQNRTLETDIKHNEEKSNGRNFKVFDPKLHRPTKKKIIINQYTEHMIYKNNSVDQQRVKTVISNTRAENFPKRGLKEDFDLSENLSLNKSDKENKTFTKDVLRDIQITINGSFDVPNLLEHITTLAKNKHKPKKDTRCSLIHSGKEIAELIVVCERSLDKFKSFYFEWIDLRKQSISLLEQILQIIDKSSKKSDTMTHIIAALNFAVKTAEFIPHPGVSMGAKVVRVIGGIFGNFYNHPKTDCKDIKAKKYEIREMFQQDIDSSSNVYMYGVQCGSQFRETCNAIAEFHKQLLDGQYKSVIDNDELQEFMNELSQYNSNTTLFYKRLRTCYEKLMKSVNSVDSKAFVKVFEDVPNAINVIELLPWQFDSDGFDNTIVEHAWEELLDLFRDDNPTTVDIIKDEVHNCLSFLKKEHRILSRTVMNLFKEELKEPWHIDEANKLYLKDY